LNSFKAAERGKDNFVDTLIDYGADVRFRDSTGDQPLHVAARHGKDRIVNILLCKGSDPGKAFLKIFIVCL